MKLGNKFVFATVLALLAVCTLAGFISVATAQTAEPYTLSVSSSNKGVNEVSTYTLVITATGSSNLTAFSITVPPDYANVGQLSVSPTSWTGSYNDTTRVINLSTSGSALSNGASITVTFEARNPITAGTYQWSSQATGTATTVTTTYSVAITSIIPAIEIFIIAAAIAFLNSGINRILVGYFIGWE